MSHSLKAGEAGFFALNRDWQYAIRLPHGENLIRFDSQTDGSWLAHKSGAENFRVLGEPVAIKMLNQALAGDCVVAALHLQTKEVMLFQGVGLSKYLQKTPTV